VVQEANLAIVVDCFGFCIGFCIGSSFACFSFFFISFLKEGPVLLNVRLAGQPDGSPRKGAFEEQFVFYSFNFNHSFPSPL
jgi:hypothetical protein